MPDILQPLPTFNNVAVNAVAVCDLPRDRRYHTIYIQATGTVSGSASTDADQIVESVSVLIDGRAMRVLTPAQLRAINGFNGSVWNGSNAKQLIVHLREPWLTDPADQHALSWGMGGVSSFRLEIKTKAGITAPAITGFYAADEGVANGKLIPLGLIKRTKIDFTAGNTGTIKVRNLSYDGVVKRIHLEASSSVITALKLTAGGRSAFEVATADLANFYGSHNLAAVSGYQTISFDQLGHLRLGVLAAGLANSELDLTLASSANINIIHEYMGSAA